MNPMSLPVGYTARAPRRDEVELVHGIVAACEAEELGEAQVDLEDIVGDWRRPGMDLERDSVVVFADGGEPAGNAELFNGRAEGNVLRAHRGRGIGTWLAAWIERRAREVGETFVRQVAPATAELRLEFLRGAGYRVTDTAWELAIDVAPSEPVRIDERFELRDFRPGIDDQAAWRLIEDAFAPWPNRRPNELEAWRSLTVLRAGFRPELLPLLWDGEELVGAAYCIDYPEDGLRWVQQLAVRETHRGGGLGAALLHEVFARAAADGRSRVGLATDSRTGALALYQRVGMQVVREFRGHVLTLTS